MALRLAWRASRSPYSRSVTSVASRAYSSRNAPLSFSVDLGTGTKDPSSLHHSLKKQVELANPNKHNSAVILATPQYAKILDDEAFMKDFVDFISGPEKPDQFHVLGAVVDHVAPSIFRNKPIQGLSILRGDLDSILPELWVPSPPKATEDADKVAALTVNFGNPRLTIPLANTTFLNHRTSTLIASRFNLGEGTPHLVEKTEKHWQQISVPLKEQLHSVKDLGLWAPLVPLTHPRVVTESFGNIVRRIDVDNQSTPASNELEPAVDELHNKKSYLVQTSMGVWAMITPPTYSQNVDLTNSNNPDPAATFDENHSATELVSATSNRLKELYGQGGRLYQILSGGGGWGVKKGLLSLDPQRTHFSLSEEEEMQRFIQAMDGGNIVPVGSKIQFFASTETVVNPPNGSFSGVMFGTAGNTPTATEDSTSDGIRVLNNHFGALSNEGIFVTSSDAVAETTPGFNNDWRLNVPHSRIFVGQVE